MTISKLRTLSNLFSANFLNYILSNKYRDYLSYIINSTSYSYPKHKSAKLSSILESIYLDLLQEYRFEYIYKNEIVNQILINRHDLNSSILLTEFRTFLSKADVVILNGTSTVYEIKTELDKLCRLPSQIESYKKFFDYRYIVTYNDNLSRIIPIVDDETGVLLLSSNDGLIEHKYAKSNIPNIIPSVIFDSFRKEEYLKIIKKEFGCIPQVPNTRIYDECKSLFSALSPEKAHSYMITTLKSRDIPQYQKCLITSVPHSLKMFCLSRKLSVNECSNLETALSAFV